MRKTLLTLLLIPVIILVSSNVSVSRDEDRSPPGIESKMSYADLPQCQLQDYQVADMPAPVAPAQDIWHSENPSEIPRPTEVYNEPLQDRQIVEAPTLLPAPDIEHPENRSLLFKPIQAYSVPLLQTRRTNTLYRWGDADHPLLE